MKRFHVSRNLFDYQTMAAGTTGYYINSSGALMSSGSWAVTDYIPVSGNQFVLSKVGSTTAAICFYNDDKQFLYGQAYATQSTGDKQSIYITIPDNITNVAYARFSYVQSGQYIDTIADLMLNTGSTALPYEPYGGEWQTKSPPNYGTGTDVVTNLPVEIFTDGQPVSSYTLKGNTSTSGTPSPSTPITINGVGEKTANLVYSSQTQTVGTDLQISQTIGSTEYILNKSETEIAVSTATLCDMTLQAGTYTITVSGINRIADDNTFDRVFVRDSDNNIVVQDVYDDTPKTFTLSETTTLSKIIIVAHKTSTYNNNRVTIMLNSGTALPYEPYGYKISISSNSTALTPVYLTEQLMKIGDYVDSVVSSGTATYNIQKLVLTGNEDWSLLGRDTGRTVFSTALTEGSTVCMCTHIEYKATYTTELNRIVIPNAKNALYISIDDTVISGGTPTATDFKTWLASQYAAGTPVTVYYVLATAATESVTAPTIPTTGGTATIDVDTTVKPSELDLTYHGWHSHEPLKRENGSWS